ARIAHRHGTADAALRAAVRRRRIELAERTAAIAAPTAGAGRGNRRRLIAGGGDRRRIRHRDCVTIAGTTAGGRERDNGARQPTGPGKATNGLARGRLVLPPPWSGPARRPH